MFKSFISALVISGTLAVPAFARDHSPKKAKVDSVQVQSTHPVSFMHCTETKTVPNGRDREKNVEVAVPCHNHSAHQGALSSSSSFQHRDRR